MKLKPTATVSLAEEGDIDALERQFIFLTSRINPATPFHPWTKVAGFSGYFL
jgi:hypothetical protein